MIKCLGPVFEHEKISVMNGHITEAEFKKLDRFAKVTNTDLYTVGNQSIKFKHYVGILQVGRTQISILPKIGNSSTYNWQQVLHRMISISRRKNRRIENTSLGINHSLIELYIWEFIFEIEELLKGGLKKGYTKTERNASCIKGKIIFEKDLRLNHSDKSKIFTRFDKHELEVWENQIILTALERASELTNNSTLQTELRLLKTIFESFGVRTFKSKLPQRLKRYNRQNLKYKPCLEIAYIILEGQNPIDSSQDLEISSFLFDMNKLYEDYIIYLFKKTLEPLGFKVTSGNKDFWGGKSIKPDIVVKKDEKCLIFDTKWKDIERYDVSDSDLKQMFIYGQYWNCKSVQLLYPSLQLGPSFRSPYSRPDIFKLAGIEEEYSCGLNKIALFNSEGNLDEDGIKSQILNFVA